MEGRHYDSAGVIPEVSPSKGDLTGKGPKNLKGGRGPKYLKYGEDPRTSDKERTQAPLCGKVSSIIVGTCMVTAAYCRWEGPKNLKRAGSL